MAALMDKMAYEHCTGGSKVEQTFASCKESADQCHCIRNAACGTTPGTALRLASELTLPGCGYPIASQAAARSVAHCRTYSTLGGRC